MDTPLKLVLLRHGESTWNQENRFTGWTDVDLDQNGFEQARNAGRLLKAANYQLDEVHTSFLKRAVRTAWLVMDEMDQMWVPELKSWRLNERHYGALQGLNKSETAAHYGEDKVKEWRRSYDIQPPALEENDERYPKNQRAYATLNESVIPKTESLKDTFNRVFPYWIDAIAPAVMAGKQVIVVAHGNTLRSLCKHFDNLSEEEVTELNIPIGQPLVYEFDAHLKTIRHYYLDNEESIQAGIRQQIEMGQAHTLQETIG